MSESTNVAAMPSRTAMRPLKECGTLAEAFQTKELFDRIAQSVPKHMSPERMLRTFVQATARTPGLLKCNMRSVIGGMLTLSQVGLEPNTPLQHAFLIPFKRTIKNKETGKWDQEIYEVQVIFGYPGLLDLSYRSSMLSAVHADVVWEKDTFSFEYGTDAHLRHKPMGRRHDGESPVWAYAHAKLKDGQAFEVLPYSEVLRIRDNAQGYRAALAAKEKAERENWKKLPATWTEAPWVKHEIQMSRKTAFRALSKWLPRSVELAAAISLDEAQERGAVDFGPVLDGASILDGELPGIEMDRPADPGAAHGQRSQEADGEAEHIPAAQAHQPKQAEPAPAARGPVLAFAAYLLDAYGEETRPEPYEDPEEFARAFLALYERTEIPQAPNLIEHNADAIEDARQASPVAASALAGIVTAAAPTGPQVVAVPEGRGAWVGYVAAIRKAVAEVSASALAAWAEAQMPNARQAPPKERLLVARAIGDRAAALRAEVPECVRDLLQGSAPAQVRQPKGGPAGDEPPPASPDDYGAAGPKPGPDAGLFPTT